MSATPIEDIKAEIYHDEVVEDASRPVYIPDAEAERRVVRKIDMRLIPMLWLMYVFNFLDRTNIGNAKVGGMEADLKLSSSDYSLALSIFFIGYLLAEVPSNMILARTRPSLYLPAMMAIWGGMTISVRGVHNLHGLVALRFFLGFAEAGFFPGVVFILSCFYKPYEMAKRMAIFYSASLMAGAFGGILAGVITEFMDGVGNTPGWQWLFVIEGITTIILAGIAVFVLPDYPATTKWLTDEEKRIAVGRLMRDDAGSEHSSEWQSFKAATKNIKTWAFVFGYMAIICCATINYFFPTLMRVLGYSKRNAQFMTVPIYATGLVISNLIGYSSDRYQEKVWHIAGSCAASCVSFLVCLLVKQPTIRYVFICFGGSFLWAAQPLFLSYLTPYFPDRHERAVVIAMVNGLGNLASVYGAQIWPAHNAPQYRIGFGVVTAMIAVGGIMTVMIAIFFGKPPNPTHIARDASRSDVVLEGPEKV